MAYPNLRVIDYLEACIQHPERQVPALVPDPQGLVVTTQAQKMVSAKGASSLGDEAGLERSIGKIPVAARVAPIAQVHTARIAGQYLEDHAASIRVPVKGGKHLLKLGGGVEADVIVNRYYELAAGGLHAAVASCATEVSRQRQEPDFGKLGPQETFDVVA